MSRHYSVFDYTVTICRKKQYLLLRCPELELSISSEDLHINKVSAEKLGAMVIRLFDKMNSCLLQKTLTQKTTPVPLSVRGAQIISCGSFSATEAAKVLGISSSTLKTLVKKGIIAYSKTPGGHLRFSTESLARVLAHSEANAEADGNTGAGTNSDSITDPN